MFEFPMAPSDKKIPSPEEESAQSPESRIFFVSDYRTSNETLPAGHESYIFHQSRDTYLSSKTGEHRRLKAADFF
jgi:hypothetical protein